MIQVDQKPECQEDRVGPMGIVLNCERADGTIMPLRVCWSSSRKRMYVKASLALNFGSESV